MEQTSLHDAYLKELKKMNVAGLEDYSLDCLLYLETLYSMNAKLRPTLTKAIVSIMLDAPEISFDISGKRILCLTTKYNRTDHDDYWKEIKSVLPTYDEIVLNWNIPRWKRLFTKGCRGFGDRLRKFLNIFSNLYFCKNFVGRIYIAERLLSCLQYKQRMELYKTSPAIVISFFDANMFECLFVHFFRMRGAISITNQHGQPIFRGFELDHLNQSQILNFNSDYYWAKGIFTKEQFINAGIASERIQIIGDIRNPEKYKKEVTERKCFVVFLDCPLYDFAQKTNSKLLMLAEKIAKILDYHYIVKLHPIDVKKNYDIRKDIFCEGIVKKELTLAKAGEQFDFGIVSASAVYVDMLGYEMRMYQYNAGVDFHITDREEYVFYGEADFLEKFHSWRKLSEEEKSSRLIMERKQYVDSYNAKEHVVGTINNILNKAQER